MTGFFVFCFFSLVRTVLHSMFSDNKSIPEMSVCQSEAVGSQFIFRLVIPKVCSLTLKREDIKLGNEMRSVDDNLKKLRDES